MNEMAERASTVRKMGLGLLQEWSGQGLGLRGASLYVRFLLESQGLNVEPDRPEDPER